MTSRSYNCVHEMPTHLLCNTRLSDHNQCFFAVTSWHTDSKLYHCAHTNNSDSDVAWFSTGYKNLCTCCSLTFWQLHKLQLSHIKLFHSTGAGITRMQLAKVVIASALVLAACVKALPEGKRALKCTLDIKLFHFWTMAVRVSCSMITNCSVLTMCNG